MRQGPFPYEQILALSTIVERGSFQGAAEYLHITQPAISQRVSQLEEVFDEPLLIRSSPPQLTVK